MAWFDQFTLTHREVAPGVQLRVRLGGTAGRPPLLLIHGYPQTHAIWHRVAQQLRHDYELVLPDLRGYGGSSKPPGDPDHANYSKRVMANDLLSLMRQLGHERFFVCGHDRGGRVAHRLALDHPQAVRRLCLIDIAPTLDMYAATDMAFARAYYHWFFLIQPTPLPEMLIGASARDYLRTSLSGRGAQGLDVFEPQALADYEASFCQPPAIHAACEDYRASAGIDLEHDREDRAAGRRIACDTALIWGANGVIQRCFEPLALWQAQCSARVTGEAVPAGHFIPEECPDIVARHLRAFMVG